MNSNIINTYFEIIKLKEKKRFIFFGKRFIFSDK